MPTHKSKYPRGHRSVTQLARYVGVTPRMVEIWHRDGKLPKPATVLDDGTKLWDTEQARGILEWHLSKQRRDARRLPVTARMSRGKDRPSL